jgi:hypothetical protein
MPYLGVNKHQSFAGSSGYTKVITDQTTWCFIKQQSNLQQQRCQGFNLHFRLHYLKL